MRTRVVEGAVIGGWNPGETGNAKVRAVDVNIGGGGAGGGQ